jgi:hypothetical protein
LGETGGVNERDLLVKRFDFRQACNTMLCEIGATPDEENAYDFVIATKAGPLRCNAHPDWLACRFDDVDAAKKHVQSGCLNRFSGKWNWHFNQPTESEIGELRLRIQEII